MKKHLNSTEPHLPGRDDEEGLGLENATLKWNEVADAEKQDEHDKTRKNEVLSSSGSSPTSSNDDVVTVATSDVETTAFVILQFGFQKDSCLSSLDLLHPGKRLFLHVVVFLHCPALS